MAMERKWEVTWRGLATELKTLSVLAAPMVAVSVMHYLLRFVSLVIAGHLGEVALSAVTIANSFAAVTGFSLLLGLAGALETLCGQAYGAEQYEKIGTYTYCSVISLIFVCFPVSLLWIFVEKILVMTGQDPAISKEAGKYAIFLLPALYGYAVIACLVRFLQTQGLTFAMVASSAAALCFHVPVCWGLVYKFELGTSGAAISLGLSYWILAAVLALYIKYSSKCEKARSAFTVDVLFSIREFFRFALPSASMTCLEWWAFEIIIFISGILPNSKVETSVLSICFATTSLHFLLSSGIAAAASTRVSNELGSGNIKAAQAAICAGLVVTAAEAVTVSVTLFCCRHFLGYAFSNEKEVVDYVAKITPFLSLSIIVDALQAVLSGVARGSGWQHLGAYVNLGSYYLFGIPIALLLCFRMHLKVTGLWVGLLAGSTLQAVLLALITSFTNWQKQANLARERIFSKTRDQNFVS